MACEDVVIVPYRDGPYLVRGPLVLRDQDGRDIELTRRTVALCRCGKSRMRPFCDGTHRLVSFQAPSTREVPWPEDARSEDTAKPAPPRRPAPRPTNGRTRTAPAVAALRRARALAGELEHRTVCCAAVLEACALIDGALRLVEATPSDAAPAYPAARYLVEGALALLSPVAARDPDVSALTIELATTAAAVGDGSWPS